MEHTPNHPLSFRFLDDEAAIQWLAENETHIQTLLSCVTRGDLEGIEAAISQAPQGILAEPLAGDPLRHTKNLVIILIHLLKQAAVAGGAHRLLCGQLEARFLQRLEESRAVPEVCRLADEAKRTFCRRVAAPRGRTASDPRIQRAIRYLEDHLTQKITLQQLATQAGLSPGVLLHPVPPADGEDGVCLPPLGPDTAGQGNAGCHGKLSGRHCLPTGVQFSEPLSAGLSGSGGLHPVPVPPPGLA